MHPSHSSLAIAALAVVALWLSPHDASAQGRGRSGAQASTPIGDVTLSLDLQSAIRSFYESRGPTGAEALPPGIRRNLARGKPLPPGIAKKAPAELMQRVPVADGYELVEVGLDVLLVEVGTSVVHDVLMNVIR